LIILEEESQGESEDESGKDSRETITAKKPGRKSGHRKREETTNEELGLQTTLDNTFKKEPKGNKGSSGPTPPKGGAPKPSNK
jgi:hypothetical protein